MNRRTCLFEIADLKIAAILPKMNNMQLDEYWDKLHSFIDKYPELEDDLKTYLSVKDYVDFFGSLSSLRDMLKDIYADKLAEELQSQISTNSSYEKINHDRLQAFMSYFYATVSIMSIDIQKADYEARLAEEDKPEHWGGFISPEPDRQKSILAVDDQPVHLNALKAHLKDTPYKLTCLTSGGDALRFIGKNQPDLFILDIMMPGMDGYELAKTIRGSGQQGKIVFLTGSSSKESVVKAIMAGGVEFIVKPATKDNVIARIAKLI